MVQGFQCDIVHHCGIRPAYTFLTIFVIKKQRRDFVVDSQAAKGEKAPMVKVE